MKLANAQPFHSQAFPSGGRRLYASRIGAVAFLVAFAWLFSPSVSADDAERSIEENAAVETVPRLALPDVGTKFHASDTLVCDVDASEDAQQCLDGLRWQPTEFMVEVGAAENGSYDRLLFFPSPRPAGHTVHDRVSMEWYAAKDSDGKPLLAPAVIVVHESGRSMPVGRIIAKGLRDRGLHAIMIHLPGYGNRRSELADKPELLLTSLRQGISDVRRARDAVAQLPLVDAGRIGVQGTSLGGFVTSTVVGLDGGFDRSFILLAGGRLDEVVLKGKKDAAKIREKLSSLGITDEQIVALARPIEPLRLAHRIRRETTWLYNGMFDDVVPRQASYALANAAKLPPEHHIELPANHYSGIIFLPVVLQKIHDEMVKAPAVKD